MGSKSATSTTRSTRTPQWSAGEKSHNSAVFLLPWGQCTHPNHLLFYRFNGLFRSGLEDVSVVPGFVQLSDGLAQEIVGRFLQMAERGQANRIKIISSKQNAAGKPQNQNTLTVESLQVQGQDAK